MLQRKPLDPDVRVVPIAWQFGNAQSRAVFAKASVANLCAD